MSGRISGRLTPYAAAAGITLVVALWFLQPWGMVPGDVFSGGEDIAALQAGITEAAQVGPFGTDPHIGAPAGTNQWAFPQLGAAILIGGWLLSGVLGVSSGAAALWMMVLTMLATSCSTLFLFRAVVGERVRWLAATLAAAVAASPFFLYKVGHLNVATIFAVPLVLGLVLRARSRNWGGSRAWWAVALVAAAVAVAVVPLWWAIAVVLLLAGIGLGALLQRSWPSVVAVAGIGVAAVAGIGFQYLLFRSARVPGASFGRGSWGANSWGGKLADLFVASPFVDHLYSDGKFMSLRKGASLEFKPAGIVCAAAVVALLLVLIKTMPFFVTLRERRSGAQRHLDTSLLAVASTVTVLFFLLGGLGNLQAAAAVFLGGESPARTFSRFSIIMAMLGMAWFLVYFARWRAHGGLPRRLGSSGVAGSSRSAAPPDRAGLAAGAVIGAAAIGLTVLDLTAVARPAVSTAQAMAEYPAIEFLRANTKPCMIAQLPQDGAIVPRNTGAKGVGLAGHNEYNALFYYRGLYPYLLADDYYWSFGSWYPKAKTALNALGSTLTPAGADALRAAGYCAVLYDKLLAARPGAGALEGSAVQGLPAPSFTSDRYDVYMLTPPG